jgi:hypothetical protein
MRTVGISRHAASISAVAALLAGCGGSQRPIGLPGAMPQSRTIAQHAKKSMSGELLYAAEMEGSDVLVFSYPQGSLVQTLAGFAEPPWSICSDNGGDVFVPTTDLGSQATSTSLRMAGRAG